MYELLDSLTETITNTSSAHLRASYPPNTIKTRPSYSYKGEITSDITTPTHRIRTIDDAIEITLPIENQVNEIQKQLNRMILASYAGILVCSYFGLRNLPAATYSNTAPFALAGLFFAYRAAQINKEYRQWNDPTKELCSERKAYAENLKFVINNNLIGRAFAKEEAPHLFFKTCNRIRNKYYKALDSHNQDLIKDAIDLCYRELPLTPTISEQIFPNGGNLIIKHSHSEVSYYKRHTFDIAREQFNKFVKAYIALEAQYKKKLDTIEITHQGVHYGIDATSSIASDLLDHKEQDQKQTEMSEEKRKKIKEEYTRKKQFKDKVSTMAQGASFFHGQAQKSTLNSDHKSAVIDLFSPVEEHILNPFKSSSRL